MLVGSLADQIVRKGTSLNEGAAVLWAHPQVRAEILGLLDVLETRLEHVTQVLSTHPDVPLQIHADYKGTGDVEDAASFECR
jgi:hypothetical protein